jgi:hypothetical protein
MFMRGHLTGLHVGAYKESPIPGGAFDADLSAVPIIDDPRR